MTTATFQNGVNLEAILGARTALADAPPAAKFQWKAEAEWVNGTHTRSTVEKFFGLGEEQSHREVFLFDTDHPQVFASEDQGATPAELLLVALAGCLGAGVATVATNRGIELRSVRATVTGDMDLHGIMGIDTGARPGYSGITVTYDIDADVSHEEKESLVAQSRRRSAVFDVVTNGVPVEVGVNQ